MTPSICKRSEELYVELNGGRDNRRATGTEILKSNTLRMNIKMLDEQIKNLKRKRDALQKTCDHKVFFDEACWPYDARVCNGCGAGLGLI